MLLSESHFSINRVLCIYFSRNSSRNNSKRRGSCSRTLFFFCAALLACQGFEPLPLVVEAQRPNHRTAREFPPLHDFGLTLYGLLPGLWLYSPDWSPCLSPHPSSLHCYSGRVISSDTEARFSHSSAPVVACLSKSKVMNHALVIWSPAIALTSSLSTLPLSHLTLPAL